MRASSRYTIAANFARSFLFWIGDDAAELRGRGSIMQKIDVHAAAMSFPGTGASLVDHIIDREIRASVQRLIFFRGSEDGVDVRFVDHVRHVACWNETPGRRAPRS